MATISNKIEVMVVRLIGAGAVGTSVAMKLKDVCDFALIVDSGRCGRYRDGLIYNGSTVSFRLAVPGTCECKADLIIVALKNFQLDGALDEIAPFADESTVFLPLLNGIDAERILSARFGDGNVLYSFITDLSSNHSGNRTECFHDGTIIFGEKDNSRSGRVSGIASLFDAAGQNYEIPDDIIHYKWWKFMMNTCFNTLSAILVADYYAIHDNSSLIKAVRMIASEVQEVALSESVVLTDSDVDSMIGRFCQHTNHGQTSMLQDLLANRETENMYFAGAVSRIGRKNGISTPLCDFASILLEAKRHVQSC